MLAMKAYLSSISRWRYIDYALLAGLILAVMALNLIWISIETRPPHWDMARHLWTSLVYRDLAVAKLLDAYYYYPPLVYINASLYYHLFGTSIRTAILSNLTFITILAYSTYGLGKTLWNRRTGLLATLLVLSTPMLVTQFKEFQIDAPLVAMATLGLYLLVKTKAFSSTRHSLLFGFAVGLGMLTKWTFGLIIALPLAVTAAEALWLSYRSRTWARVINLALAGLAALFVAGHWYLTHRREIRADLLQNGVNAGEAEGDPVVGTLASNSWYFWNLVNFQLYVLPMALFIAGLAWLRKSSLRANLYPILLIIGTVLVFTMLRNKDARYTLPILPAVAVLATYWLSQLKTRWMILPAAVAAYCVLSFGLISFGTRALPRDVAISLGSQHLELFGQHGYIIGPPTKEQWHMQDMFGEILAQNGAGKVLGYGGLDTIWFNSYDLLYYATRDHITIQATQPADFIALRGLTPLPSPEGFSELRDWQLPDQSQLVLYQRNKP